MNAIQMAPEGKVKKKLKADLDAHGVYYYMPVPGGYGRPSVDFLCCTGLGVFMAIETKANGRELTPRQRTTLEDIKNHNGQCWVVTLDGKGELVWTRF